MRKWLLVFVIILSLTSVPANSQNEIEPVIGQDGHYRIELVAQQYNFTMIDLNMVDQLVANGQSTPEARQNSILTSHEVSFQKGKEIIIYARSIDVDHGILISNLDITLLLPGPVDEETYGEMQQVKRSLLDFDYTVKIFCNEYCGDGHSDMIFYFDIGEGGDRLPGNFTIKDIALVLYLLTIVLVIGFFALLIRKRLEVV